MSCFRPDGGGGLGAFIGYLPYCVPRIVDNVKGVLVNEALRELEPMAWDFVMNFARRQRHRRRRARGLLKTKRLAMRAFSWCARQGALTWRCKSSTHPARGRVSRRQGFRG
jgi:hypothetical protein